MAKQKDLAAYDKRYQILYENGVTFWNDHEPHPVLLQLLDQLKPGSHCMDLGCGEGFEARAMARAGMKVTAVDLSPTVIKKAIEATPADLDITFLTGDVTDLNRIGIQDNRFDLVTNIGCLHMMQLQEDRNAHLHEIKRVLKPGGLLYLQNGLCPDDVVPQTPEEEQILQGIKQTLHDVQPYEPIPRKIMTSEGEKEILLPLCPAGKTCSMAEYKTELKSAGFTIVHSERSSGANMPFEGIFIAECTD